MVAGCAGLSALLILHLAADPDRAICWRTPMRAPRTRSRRRKAPGSRSWLSVFAGCAVGILVWAPERARTSFGVLVAAAGLTLLGAIDDAHTLSVWSRLLGPDCSRRIAVVA